MRLTTFKKTRLIVYIIPFYLFQDFAVNAVAVLVGSLIATELTPNQQYIPLVVTFLGFITNFIPNLLTGTFVILLWIVSKHFEAINERIATTLRLSLHDIEFLAQQVHSNSLARLRMQHEQLVNTVHHLEKAFGLQVQ